MPGLQDVGCCIALADNQACEHGAIGTPAQLKCEEATQLHQALEWLKPPEGSEQMEAWSSLRSRLQAAAQDSPIKPFFLPRAG